MGTPEIAVPSLHALMSFPGCSLQAVYTQPDRPFGRKKRLTPSPVKVAAEACRIPVNNPMSVKAEEAIEELRQLQPDLIIVCAYGQILPQALLDIPLIGCFNLHFSFLPRWRGASPVHTAIRAGDDHTGVCLQKVVFKLDAGPIAAYSPKEPIHPADTYSMLAERLSHISAKLLTQTLPLLCNQTFKLKAQNESDVTYCHTIKKEAGCIQWEQESAVEIERKLRAFTPWPGIYTFDAKGKRLQITKVEIRYGLSLPAGFVQPELVIGTSCDAIRVIALKPEGKKEMAADEFLRGHSHLVGTKLQLNKL
ncbi:MAG: methionyl-tRNA formyltransferase [SAR324 cluster bacterium]|nr:methionyl-tRNA formyltransferase [SAR324 cluster bacterium]